MKIEEFINEYSNHPVLFIGTGLSLRYLNNSYSWENLLQHICYQLTGNKEIFYDYKDECQKKTLLMISIRRKDRKFIQ